MTLPSPINTGPVTGVEAQLLQIATMNATNILELKEDMKAYCSKNSTLEAKVDQLSIDVRAMKAAYDEAKLLIDVGSKGLTGKGATGVAVGASTGVLALFETVKWLVTFFRGS